MSEDKQIIFSMTKVGKQLPSGKNILKDIYLSFFYGAKIGIIGSHPTELPKYRGRAPIPWTILKGLKKSALTFFFIEEGMDDGDILDQQFFEIIDYQIYNKFLINYLIQYFLISYLLLLAYCAIKVPLGNLVVEPALRIR